MIREAQQLLEQLQIIHGAIRDQVLRASEEMAAEQLSAIVAEQAGDVVFAIDRISEEVLLKQFARLAERWSFVLIAEGLSEDGVAVFPRGIDPAQAELRIIIDPIDGTRGVMYQKRAAWILTGVAPNHGSQTGLHQIELAIQTEIPLVKQHLCDSLWAIKGQGAHGQRLNRLTGEVRELVPRPSQATTIAQGYGNIARFFPGGRAALAALDDAVVEALLGPVQQGRAQAFEDQYISTGGQLYELMMGHDRWLADLRPLVPMLKQTGLCCHPYDLCTELIAREAGVIVTNEHNQPLDAPLDVDSKLAWIGFANAALAQQIMPHLQRLMRTHHFIGA
jgi:fructose-1,6-bisphosphatase/inositol monophosphatase family enzyme